MTERRDTTAEDSANAEDSASGTGDRVSGTDDPTSTAGGSGQDRGGTGTGPEPATKGRSRWRRWWVLVVVVVLVTATITLSPLSPFEQAQPHGRVPVPPGGLEPTPHSTEEPPPKPGPSIPGPSPTAPPPSAPTPEPDRPPAPPTAPAPAAIRGEGYTLAYSDEFEGSAPDTDVWATAPFGGSLPATVGGGAMTIESTRANDYMWGYVASTGPRAESEPNYRNPRAWEQGYFEARVRYTDNAWAWPAFWLFSMSKTEAWPGEDCSNLNAEWDVMENGIGNGGIDRPSNRFYFTVLHRNTTDNTPEGYCNTPDEQRHWSREFPDVNLADWHTWAAYWSSDRFCTYMDDVLLTCMEPYDSTSQPMHLTFTIQYHPECEGCGPRPDELEMQVDWVRVWREQ